MLNQVNCTLQVAFLVGILYLIVGVFRLGFFANFLSHSVISGFTTGAALIIGLSQLKYFFGISIPSTETALQTFIELCKALDDTQWREVVMCSVWLFLLITMKHLAKRFKKLSWLRPLGPITVCVIAIVTVVIGDLDGRGLIRTVRHIPQGVSGLVSEIMHGMFHGLCTSILDANTAIRYEMGVLPSGLPDLPLGL